MGYPSEHKGYRCLDLASNRIIVSRHVVFDESSFPFAELPAPLRSSNLDFLTELDFVPSPVGTPLTAGTSGPPAPDGHAPQVAASGVHLRPLPAAPTSVPLQAVASRASEPAAPVGVAAHGSEAAAGPPPGFGAANPAAGPPGLAPGPPPGFAPAGPLSRGLASPGRNPVRGDSSPAVPMRNTPPGVGTAAGHVARRPPSAVPIDPIANSHTMCTRGKSGFRLPVQRLNLQATTLSPIPKSYHSALADPNWRDAMIEEFTALQANHTWDLVPLPQHANVVTGKWVFR